MSKRVYHPTLNSWADVPDGDVSAWTRKGWKASKPGHIVEPVKGGPAVVPAEPVKVKPAKG